MPNPTIGSLPSGGPPVSDVACEGPTPSRLGGAGNGPFQGAGTPLLTTLAAMSHSESGGPERPYPARKSQQLKGKLCVLCRDAPASRKSEHIWPTWMLRMIDGANDPSRIGEKFTMHVNDEPVRKSVPEGTDRPGEIRWLDHLQSSHAPTCIPCNGILNRRFENPVRDVVRRLIPIDSNHTWPVLSSEEVVSLAKWMLKVGLLLKHPETRHDDRAQAELAEQWTVEQAVPVLYDWMINGQDPPDGLTVYMQIRDPGAAEVYSPPIPMPTVITDAGAVVFVSTIVGVRGVDFPIAYHPGWTLSPAAVAEGSTIAIWPPPLRSIDVGAIPPSASGSIRFIGGGRIEFRPGVYGTPAVPPLTDGFNMLDLVESGLAVMATW